MPPALAAEVEAAEADHERLRANRTDPDHRPVMRPDAGRTPPHTETSPAFRAMQLGAALAKAQRAWDLAKDAAREARGRGQRDAARARVSRAKRARDEAQAALNREVEGGDAQRLAVLEEQGRVEQAVRDDPSDTNERSKKPRQVRGFRARVHYVVTWEGGGLGDAEREAADKYVVLCEAELSAGRRLAAYSPSPAARQTAHPGGGHPVMSQVQAAAALRAVHEAVGADATALLRLYVRDNVPVSEIAARRAKHRPEPDDAEAADKLRAEDQRVIMGRIRAALTRAAEFWRIS